MKRSPGTTLLALSAYTSLAFIDVSSATDWETPVAREAVSSHESLDVYRPYCRTLGIPRNRSDWGEGDWNTSFCSVNRYSSATTDFDEVDDTRDFTSEALFSASGSRLSRTLTDAELRGIVRKKDKVETFNSLKLNPGLDYLPTVELFYKYRDLQHTQITHFFAPDEFNDVALSEYGAGLSKRIPVSAASEITLRGGYRRIDREGIVEFLPRAHEDIDHREAGARWDWGQGRNKYGHHAREAGVSFYYVYQDIEQRIPNPSARDRNIFAAKARYKTDLSDGAGAVEIFGGLALDDERYDRVHVNKHDYFAGITLFRPAAASGYWAFTVQPSVFTSEVSNDASQDNSQYRFGMIVGRYFYTGPDTWWAIVLPYRRDAAHEGPDAFENFKLGAEIQCKQLTWGNGHLRWFGSLGYDYEDFRHIAKSIHSVSATMSVSF